MSKNTEEKNSQKKETVIPKIIQIIWVGSMVPDKYQQNIKAWKALNPDYQVKLWVDSDLLTQAENGSVAKFCQDNQIIMQDIAKHGKANGWFPPNEPSPYYDSVIGENRNWAIASNFARFKILEEEGGLYVDTDIACNQPLGTLNGGPFGMISNLIASPLVPRTAIKTIEDISVLADNIVAATPGNPAIVEMNKLMLDNYRDSLENNQTLEEMRSKDLGKVKSETYRIVGPDVLAKAFVNAFRTHFPEKMNDNMMVFNAFLRFFPLFDVDGKGNRFTQSFDNTWIPALNIKIVKLYHEVLREMALRPLLEIFKNQKELIEPYFTLQKIISNNLNEPTKAIKQALDFISSDKKLHAEFKQYFYDSYFSLTINEYYNRTALYQALQQGDKNATAYLERIQKNRANSDKKIQDSHSVSNTIIKLAREAQPNLEDFFNRSRYDFAEGKHDAPQMLTLAVKSGELQTVERLLSLGAKASQEIFQIAAQSGHRDIAKKLYLNLLSNPASPENEGRFMLQTTERDHPFVKMTYFSQNSKSAKEFNLNFNENGEWFIEGKEGEKLSPTFSTIEGVANNIKAQEFSEKWLKENANEFMALSISDVIKRFEEATDKNFTLLTPYNEKDNAESTTSNRLGVPLGTLYKYDQATHQILHFPVYIIGHNDSGPEFFILREPYSIPQLFDSLEELKNDLLQPEEASAPLEMEQGMDSDVAFPEPTKASPTAAITLQFELGQAKKSKEEKKSDSTESKTRPDV